VPGNPASRKRCAKASAAAVTLPTESVVLISISCLKISSASLRDARSSGDGCCAAIDPANIDKMKKVNHNVLETTRNLRKEFGEIIGHLLRLKAIRFD
jgi:hypothetical protein